MQWSAKYSFVSDDPAKVTMQEHDLNRTQVVTALLPLVHSARVDITIISPYFVPSGEATPGLVASAKAGARVRVLTNSLVANDVAAVHGGYSRYRKPLLAGGVQLWELKPLAGAQADSSLFGSSGASLHTKALSVDKRTLFVGSYNVDPRSTFLNCEQGVLVENEVLAAQLDAIFAKQSAGQRSWRVTLTDDNLAWSDGTESFSSDPHASVGRRFQAWITRVLHLDAQL
jgi:putative cardiolipin synthase